MISRYLGEGRYLLDREAAASNFGYSAISIRRHCPIADYDETTGRALYDSAIVAQVLAAVRPRRQPTRREWGRLDVEP